MIEITQNIFSYYNVITLGMNNKMFGKPTNFWKLSHVILNSLLVWKDITHESRKYFKISDNKKQTYQSLWDRDKIVLRINILGFLSFKKSLKTTI